MAQLNCVFQESMKTWPNLSLEELERDSMCGTIDPDVHWSATFYKGGNAMQLMDGRALQCSIKMMPQGHDIVTTRCDSQQVPHVFTNHFIATGTTAEICTDVVKRQGSFPRIWHSTLQT